MPNALLVSPKNPITFWSFDEALKMIGKKNAFPPLGLLTIAGMMPERYELRVIDMNVTPLTDQDLEWADVVITSSMIIHWPSLEDVIARCNILGVPVLNGGPLPTQYSNEIEGNAVFYLGEAENGFIDDVDRLVDGSEPIERETIDRRGLFQDLATTPIPRWDLIDFKNYSAMVVQITRGCPESCTFCNIPSLYGKTMRIKAASRMVQEFDALYDAGWRGSVMAVDDNFVGNADAIRVALEEEVIPWQRERDYPFQFHTQASIRLSDDEPLLDAMWEAGFDKVFAGIESPVEESLKFMGARKNLQGDTPLLDKVLKLQSYGFEVQAGFIMGLDTDPEDIGDRVIAFIRAAGIPVAMVGILGVLRDTPDYKRFSRAGRLVEGAKYTGDSGVFSRQLSFVPKMDPDVLMGQHRNAVQTLNSPEIYFERCKTLFDHMHRRAISRVSIGWSELRALGLSIWRQGLAGSYRRRYWGFLGHTLLKHPSRLPDAVRLAVQGHHLIVTTQQALHVDEVKTFFEVATAELERFAGGSREALKNVEGYASRLMSAVNHRFVNLADEKKAVRTNAEVLIRAAHEYCDAVRDEFRHQIAESLEEFQTDIERILVAHTGEPLSQTRA
ncbi:MAG: radical SAM protein [Gemmatimonadetes bacterium]|nr:radical SAM protein [Gemmatimonadota bacterium]|tara:strand:- start:657 stop:2498 length:1842 start_codon:yes stop_codon:yes gene_type:complete